jgi:hypothetical protein
MRNAAMLAELGGTMQYVRHAGILDILRARLSDLRRRFYNMFKLREKLSA